jgi:hypothetical protein
VFAHIGRLHEGDLIVVTTTQGQSVYAVARVQKVHLTSSATGSDRASAATGRSGVHLTAAARRERPTTIGALFGPTSDDRLTLVTSATRTPWDTSSATEVVARLTSKPFPPTPQQARNPSETGTRGDGGLLAAVVLALLAFAGVIAGSVALYDKLRFRTAYILTVAPLVAITVITGETLVRLLPAWT